MPDSPKRYRMVPLPATPPPSSPERRLGKYDDLISECAREFDVDPALVKAVIRAESGFDSRAVSPRGARGLMQLMPRTARGQGVSDVHDPRQNVRAGVRYLRTLLDRYQGDRRLALAAYNAGSGAVKRYGGLPPHRETRTYVGRVLQFHKQYERSRHRSSPAAPVPRAALRAEADPFAPVAVPDVRPITGCWTLARSAACTP